MTAERSFLPVIGDPPELVWLPIAKLSVDPKYQREITSARSRKKIDRIAAFFRWAAFGAIQACKIDDGWNVIDGQHRVEAARKRGDIPHVPAVVVSLSQAEQAAAFVEANDRLTITGQEIFHAKVAAGDAEAVMIARLCKDAGVTVTRYNIGAMFAPPGSTSSASALYTALHAHGEATLGATLRALKGAFGKERGGLSPNAIRGAALAIGAGMTKEQLTRALRGVGVLGIQHAAFGAPGANMRALAVCKVLQRSCALEPNLASGVSRAQLMAGR